LKYQIEGKKRICGKLEVQGARNSAIPVLAASLLTKKSVIYNIPNVIDTDLSLKMLEFLCCDIHRTKASICVTPNTLRDYKLPEDLLGLFRSSFIFLGAMLGRCGMVKMNFPGGCEIGPRPIDMHIKGLRELGVDIDEAGGELIFKIKDKLKGTTVDLAFPSVGATENILLAASTAEGETTIANAAKEPEVDDLIDFLNSAGARIERDGHVINVIGVESLGKAEHTIIPDRVATITYLAAAAITGGEITLSNIRTEHIREELHVLKKMGCSIEESKNNIYLKADKQLQAAGSIKTDPFPGFSTDALPILTALFCVADGTTIISETIFEERFRHINEFIRMGAQAKIENRIAVIEGTSILHGCNVECTDLRGGTAVVIAALSAEGSTIIDNILHIKRSYQDFSENLQKLGAEISELS